MKCWIAVQVVAVVVLCGLESQALNPRPNTNSVVAVGGARFTVLTERLVRMEWGGNNDEATFAFVNRYLPTPSYTVTTNTSTDTTTITTAFLKARLMRMRSRKWKRLVE